MLDSGARPSKTGAATVLSPASSASHRGIVDPVGLVGRRVELKVLRAIGSQAGLVGQPDADPRHCPQLRQSRPLSGL